MPRLATAPARVIIDVAFVPLEVEGKGVGTSELTNELLAVPEWVSSPSSRASRRCFWLDVVHVDFANFLEAGYEVELTVVADGTDKD